MKLSDDERAEASTIMASVRAGANLTDLRVSFIARQLASMRWVAGKHGTASELAEIWDLSVGSVMNIYSIARRELRRVGSDSEDLKDLLIANLEHVARSSMEAKKPFLDKTTGEIVYAEAPDHSAALSAIDKITDLAGLKKKKHEHVHNHNYAAMSPGEILGELKKWREERQLHEPERQQLGPGTIDTEGSEQLEEATPKGVHSK